MRKKKLFNIKTITSFVMSLFILSSSCIILASPNLEKNIKSDLSIYVNNLNNGKISEYYNIYNTRKLTDIEKSLFYDKIKNAIKVVDSESETFQKFRLKVKIKKVTILKKVKNNIYLCNLSVDYQVREGIDTTKTIKKSDEFILKILDTGKDGYKVLLPFNSMDKDFSESEVFTYLEQLYKIKKSKEIEEKRLLEQQKQEQEKLNENNKDTSEITNNEQTNSENSTDSTITTDDNSSNKQHSQISTESNEDSETDENSQTNEINEDI